MREIKLNESMNDDSFKEKCRESSFIMLNKFVELLNRDINRDNIHADEAMGLSLLYMVSQMPDTKEKHCEKASATEVRKTVDNLFNDLFDSMNNPSTKDFSTEEKEQNNCAFCSGHKKSKQILIDNGATGVYLDAKKKIISYENNEYWSDKNEPDNLVIRYFPIAYCPVCGRKL